MVKQDCKCEFQNQGNINFIIIKNSKSVLNYNEYVEESLKLCDKFDEYSNLNMNIIFIHNIIIYDDNEERNGIEKDSEENYEKEKIKLKNNNVNITLLKNIINVRGERK
ncbi:TPA: hypothetical protein PTV43_001477 [Clostridium botulinum]|nr:hypothetical protein [Clostridium botulinum]